ncbi:MAG: DUF488 domain-containing protein [Burkholderiales bacterium]|nr:DUF488 domain-containing protein [Burkholderiales bacterium]
MVQKAQNKLRFKRQRTLADWLRTMGPETDDFEVQLRVFQLTVGASDKTYEFSPTYEGPHSFQLENELPLVRAYLEGLTESQVFIESFRKHRTNTWSEASQIFKEIIDKWPFYGINSVRLEAKTPKVEQEKEAIEKKRNGSPTIFTIGYEGRSLEEFLNLLIRKGVVAIADVRAVAYSYKFGFSKAILKSSAEAVELKYGHFPELGIDSQLRAKHQDPKERIRMFDKFRNSLANKISFLENLAIFASSHRRVALLCFEREASNCHRQHLRNWLSQTLNFSTSDL